MGRSAPGPVSTPQGWLYRHCQELSVLVNFRRSVRGDEYRQPVFRAVSEFGFVEAFGPWAAN